MATQRITLSSDVLKWARVTRFGANIDEAASKLKVTREQITDWETINPTVTPQILKRIAKVYKRHITVLLLQTPPISSAPPKFRTLPNFENIYFDSSTFLAIRSAQEIQGITKMLLANNINQRFINLKKHRESASDLAKFVIQELNVTNEMRFETKTTRQQLSVWKRLIESCGVIVVEHLFPIKDSRAFTLYDDLAPIIILNGRDTDNARVFSLFHELGHLIMGQTDSDDTLDLYVQDKTRDELFCNQFAASFLVPDELLKESVVGVRDFNDENVKVIANKFKVSSAVVWRRLYDGNFIDLSQLKNNRKRLATFEWFEKLDKKKKSKGGGNADTFLYTTMKRKGELYISEVFEAYNSKRITYYEVLDYTGVKPTALRRLQELMFA